MGETIKRRVRRERFTTVNNEYLQDVSLSWKAKGLITYIMSLPSDWVLNVQDLKNRSKDGRDATAAGVIFDLNVQFATTQKPNDRSRFPVVTLVANESSESVRKIKEAYKPVKELTE